MNTFQNTLGLAATHAKLVARERLVPALVIILGVLVGIHMAVLVRSYLASITNALIVVVQWSTGLLEHVLPKVWASKLTHLDTIDETAPGFDFGLGAFGAVFLLTQLKEIVATVTELISKWKTADVALLTKAFVGLVLGFAALGLSVYGLKKLAEPTTSPTFAFDTLAIPPTQVRADGGYTTFYISFPDEGGPPTFTQKAHPSVTVSDGDTKFLKLLGPALALCGRNKPVELELQGFASGSLWTAAEPALRAMLPREAAASGTAPACNPNSPNETDAPRNALACITQYKDSERKAVSGPEYLSSDTLEAGKAFNVYLANRRRAAVADILGLRQGSASGIKLNGSPWDNHFLMQQAMAIDDSHADGTFRVKGILTRSVALTITNPSACSVSNVQHVAHTAITFK
jgi:hypothetical protein